MDEIRCPMCGKPNPADLEECQHCQARLKPLMNTSDWQAEEPLVPESTHQPSDTSGDETSMDEWLSFLRENEEAGDDQGSSGDSTFEWLEDDTDDESDQEIWMGPDEPDEDLPDWLKEMGTDDLPAEPERIHFPEEEGDQEIELEGEEEPDWLQKIRTRQMEESSTQPETEFGSTAEPGETAGPELGDDLDEELSLIAEFEQDVEPGEYAGEAVPEFEIEQEALPEGMEEEIADELPEPAEEEFPAWMAGVVAGSAAAASLEVDAETEGLPEWLSDLEKSSTLDQEEIVPFGEEGDDLTFDWLQSQVRADQDIPFGDMSEPEGELADIGPVSPFVGDLSDFLEDAELSTLESGDVLEETKGEDLAPADLPHWLEAMRPIDAAAGMYAMGDKDAPVESSGPLAGLQGVLPVEPEIAQLKKPIAYALRLQVSENQQAHADLFEKLVKSEGEPKAIAGRPVLSSQYLFRLIIFVVLLLAIAWPIFTRSQVVPLPGLSPEVLDTSKIIGDLPDNPLVLLAVDYEPGLAGELEAISAVVVDHLMLKGAYLTLVSTTPNGPALAERMISEISASGGHSYQGIDRYANLGYIPGGVIGLQGFARSPRQVAPYALDPDSTSVWTRPPLNQAQNLAEFDLVAVLSDDPGRAKAWIEQVQPALDDTPMVALISSQAEPLVRPYYHAYPKQVQGMVVGLAGGGSYENAHQDLAARSGVARRYWDAYTLGMLAAAILIGAGGVVNVFAKILETQKQAKAGGKS
jgi:hypothetical protein